MAKKNILTKGKKAKAEQLALAHQLVEAEALFASVCKIDPMDAEAWVKRGVIQCRLGRYAEAESHVRRSLLLAPSLSFAREALATILQYQGKAAEASVLLQKALEERPDSAQSLADLASLRENQGRVEEAFALYHQALDLQPETPYVLAKRGELLEKEGRVEEADAVIARGLACEPHSPDLNLMAAKLERRRGKSAEAVVRLEGMLHLPMSRDALAEVHILLGQLHDLLGNADVVLTHLIKGKRLVSAEADPDGSGCVRFLDRIENIQAWARDCTEIASHAEFSAQEAPVFLIGFLRSGTTLLEQILDSHPRVQALNEKPMAAVMEREFIKIAQGKPGALKDLSVNQLRELHQAYWGEAALHCDRQQDTFLVDKQPLNIVRVPLLWRAFPQSPFILAVRHPCDVVLGCLMQKFGYNNVMSGFADLESIALLYVRVMSAWCEFVERLPLRWQQIRYEDLVDNVESEARKVLEFIGVGWSDAVLEHSEHAQTRGIINTPSYHQVTKPIYRHARYRWKRYEKELAPVIQMLQPFIERFGYSD